MALTSLDQLFDRCIPEPNTGCCIVENGYLENGYVRYYEDDGSRKGYHKKSYELKNGPVPDSLVLDHTCRVRCCANPDHVEPVTNAVNVARGLVARNHTISDDHRANISRGLVTYNSLPDNLEDSQRRMAVARNAPNRIERANAAKNNPEYRAKQSERAKAAWARRRASKEAVSVNG